MRVQEGKGLDIKPPDLGVGGGLALVVHRERASHVVQRVGTSVQGVKKKTIVSCLVSYAYTVI